MVAKLVFGIDDLRDYAARAGLGLNFVVKEAFIFELIEEIGTEHVVLKGGTAINKGYLEGHQRFSEDLDYDTDLSKEEIKAHVKRLDWKVRKESFTKYSIGFMMGYEFGAIKDVVRLDISFGIKNKAETRKITSDFVPVSKITTMYRFDELNHQKEVAFEKRKEWKDLYDLYWMHELYAHDFRIRNKKVFLEALSGVGVPKIANAYIPSQKRPNWDYIIEVLQQI